MVGRESEAVRRARDRRALAAAGHRTPSERPWVRLRAAAPRDACEASRVYPGSVAKSPDSPAPLRSAATLAAPAIFRMDRVGQARGNQAQTPGRGDSPAGQR